MLKFPTIIVLSSVSPIVSVTVCFIYLGAPVLGAYMLTSVVYAVLVLITFSIRPFFVLYAL